MNFRNRRGLDYIGHIGRACRRFPGWQAAVAREFKYFANLERYRSWVRLSIDTEETFELVISFHGYGYENGGIMVASAFTSQRVPREEGGREPVNTQAAAQELFRFNYAEPLESTEMRFNDWQESVIAIALAKWKRLLSA